MNWLGGMIALGLAALGIPLAHGAELWPAGLSFVGLKGGQWQLYLVAPDGGAPRPVPTALEPRTPTYHPRTGRVAYIGADGHLREIALDSRTERVLLEADARHAYTQPAYDPEGQRLFVVALKEGASVETDIVVLDETRQRRQPVVTQPLAQFEPHFQAPDTLYYSSVHCSLGCGKIIQEIWRLNVASGEAEQVTLVNAIARQPVVSGDRRWLYFASNRAGHYHVWRLALATGQYERLTDGRVTDSSPALDRDGHLYFLRHSPAGARLMRREADGAPRELALPEAFEDLRNLEIAP